MRSLGPAVLLDVAYVSLRFAALGELGASSKERKEVSRPLRGSAAAVACAMVYQTVWQAEVLRKIWRCSPIALVVASKLASQGLDQRRNLVMEVVRKKIQLWVAAFLVR